MSGTGGASYTIQDLVDETGIPATTIHHYRNAGLLPPPEVVAANRFRYTDRHVQALRLIRLLRERRRLPLAAIREALPELLATGDEEAFHAETWEAVVAGHAAAGEEMRDRIIAAAVELFAARGYPNVTVGDVAAKAGTAKGNLYRYFESKEALFAAGVDAVVTDVIDGMAAQAERAGRPLEFSEAIPVLLVVARPAVMLLLELTAGSLRGEPGYLVLADRALTRFVDGVGSLLAGSGSPRERATALVVQLANEAMSAILGVAAQASGDRLRSEARSETEEG
jgi:AcrR family transcriptional regulator